MNAKCVGWGILVELFALANLSISRSVINWNIFFADGMDDRNAETQSFIQCQYVWTVTLLAPSMCRLLFKRFLDGDIWNVSIMTSVANAAKSYQLWSLSISTHFSYYLTGEMVGLHRIPFPSLFARRPILQTCARTYTFLLCLSRSFARDATFVKKKDDQCK